jgi:hypothetical protein
VQLGGAHIHTAPFRALKALESAAAGRLAERLSVCCPGENILDRAPLTRTRSFYSPFADSQAIFCACLALSLGVEIVVFSPARRASRKLLERIVE